MPSISTKCPAPQNNNQLLIQTIAPILSVIVFLKFSKPLYIILYKKDLRSCDYAN